MQVFGRELFAERLRAQIDQQGVLLWVVGGVQPRAEAARVAVAQTQATAQVQLDVIVLAVRRGWIIQAQAARHAEVYDQRCAVIQSQQKIFRAPLDGGHAPAGDFFLKACGNRPAQAALPHDGALNTAADEVGSYTAASGFNFGQLGHSSCAA